MTTDLNTTQITLIEKISSKHTTIEMSSLDEALPSYAEATSKQPSKTELMEDALMKVLTELNPKVCDIAKILNSMLAKKAGTKDKIIPATKESVKYFNMLYPNGECRFEMDAKPGRRTQYQQFQSKNLKLFGK